MTKLLEEPALPQELLASKLAVGHCIISSTAEAAEARVVSVITSIARGLIVSKYLCKFVQTRSTVSTYASPPTPVNDFGCRVYHADGKVWCKPDDLPNTALRSGSEWLWWPDGALVRHTAKPPILMFAAGAFLSDAVREDQQAQGRVEEAQAALDTSQERKEKRGKALRLAMAAVTEKRDEATAAEAHQEACQSEHDETFTIPRPEGRDGSDQVKAWFKARQQAVSSRKKSISAAKARAVELEIAKRWRSDKLRDSHDAAEEVVVAEETVEECKETAVETTIILLQVRADTKDAPPLSFSG